MAFAYILPNLTFSLKVVLRPYDKKSNIVAPVLLNINSLQKSDKMLGKPHILSLFQTHFINSMKQDPLFKAIERLDQDCMLNFL